MNRNMQYGGNANQQQRILRGFQVPRTDEWQRGRIEITQGRVIFDQHFGHDRVHIIADSFPPRRLTIGLEDLDGDGSSDQFGLVLEPSTEMLMPFVFQNGGKFQDEDGTLRLTEPAFIEAVSFYLALYKNGIATIPSDMGAGWNGDVVGREQAAMCISKI